MNLKILDSWLRVYLSSKVKPTKLQELLSLSGPAIERITPFGKDSIYELEITNNRIDLASVYGLAREAKTILNHQGISAKILPLEITKSTRNLPKLPLKIEDPDKLTHRLLGVAIDVPENLETPSWLKERLVAAGIRSLNFLIDITNYVMLEVGHPLHVFDYDRLQTNRLVIRKSKPGETLITLDGVKHTLTADDVVIADENDRIVDLPGIMGCQNSVVTDKTRKILLFAEVNDPVRIRRTSMRLATRTLAANYNENSPDRELALLAIHRAITLYTQAGLTQISAVFDSQSNHATLTQVALKLVDLERYMNLKLESSEVVKILEDLEITLVSKKGDRFLFEIPSFRAKDIQIKEDLIEEIARIYGYNKLPTVIPPFEFISDDYIRGKSKQYQVENRIKTLLADLGYFEIYNYSMISEEQNMLFNLPKDSIRMVNPMSQELVYFRQSLVPSLVNNAIQNKGLTKIGIFEVANVYLPQPKALPNEQLNLGILLKGKYNELKGVVEAALKSGFIVPSFIPSAALSFLKNPESARILVGERSVGMIGQVSPKLLYGLGLKGEYVVAELNLSELTEHYQLQAPLPVINNQSEIIEDLTYKVTPKVNWNDLTKDLLAHFREIKRIEYLTSFEQFRTMRIFSQPTSTKSILSKIYDYLEEKHHLKIKRPKVDNSE